MGQKHYTQHGAFHVTTNVHWDIPWCTVPGIPQILIARMFECRTFYAGKLYAFCVLPDHVHMIINPGRPGLSTFVQMFKSNAMRDVHTLLRSRPVNKDICMTNPQPGLIRVDDKVSATMSAIRWKKGFFVREISGERQWDATMSYVQRNGVRHGLASDVSRWPWSSLHYREKIDWHEAY